MGTTARGLALPVFELIGAAPEIPAPVIDALPLHAHPAPDAAVAPGPVLAPAAAPAAVPADGPVAAPALSKKAAITAMLDILQRVGSPQRKKKGAVAPAPVAVGPPRVDFAALPPSELLAALEDDAPDAPAVPAAAAVPPAAIAPPAANPAVPLIVNARGGLQLRAPHPQPAIAAPPAAPHAAPQPPAHASAVPAVPAPPSKRPRALKASAAATDPPPGRSTRSSGKRAGLVLLSLVTAVAALASPVRSGLKAVERKALLKQQSSASAKSYLASVLPPGLVNPSRPPELGDGDFELHPPEQRTDEWGIRAARRHFAGDPAVLAKINEAEASELARHLSRFKSFRPITSANPMEPDAYRVSSLIFIKFKRDGRVTARLAACGNQQVAGSYSESYASTSDHATFACILAAYYAYAAAAGVPLSHSDFDITGAFLQCPLPRSATGGKQLLMKLPDGLDHPLSGQWVEVLGAIYGLKQSNAIFERDLATCLATIGLVPAHELGTHVTTAPDTSVYHLQDPAAPTRRLTLVIHVDDGQVFCTCPRLKALLQATLEGRYGAIAWNELSPQHVGSTITRHPNGAVALDMEKPILKALHSLGMDAVEAAVTPSSSTFYEPSSDVRPADIKEFQAIVGTITYFSRVRHDITKEVSHLASLASKPTMGDRRKAIRVLQYLKGFPATPAVYSSSEGVRLCAHVDASFANRPSGASTSCVYLTIGSTSAPFYSKTYVPDDIALSPAHAELGSLDITTVKLILRYQNLLAAIGFPQGEATPIFTDNQPVIDMTRARTIPRPSRFLRAHAHFIRSEVAKGTLTLVKRDTNVHGPDLGTKEHGPRTHHFLTKITMNLDALPAPSTPPVI